MEIEKIHRHLRHQRIATYAIVAFLVVLSGAVIFISLQAQSDQVADLRSQAAGKGGQVATPTPVNENSFENGPIFDSEEEAARIEITDPKLNSPSIGKSFIDQYELKNLRPSKNSKAKPNTPNSPESANITFKVYPILFVPSDKHAKSAYRDAINETFQLLKRWYSGTLEKTTGYTYEVAGVTVYSAPEVFEYYKCVDHAYPCGNSYDGVWDNVQDQLTDAGFPIWEEGNIHMVFVVGAGGWAGATCWLNGCTADPGSPPGLTGFGIMGDWALDGISGTVNPDCVRWGGDACKQPAQRGAVGHEIGHTFGLWHPDGEPEEDSSIMSGYWSWFPFISNTGPHKNLLWRSKFVRSVGCDIKPLPLKTIMKRQVKTNQQFNVRFVIQNNSYCKWDPSQAKLKLIKRDVWGTNSIQISDTLYPAQWYSFAALLTAPGTPGNYPSLWGLQKNNIYYGPKVGRTIKVN